MNLHLRSLAPHAALVLTLGLLAANAHADQDVKSSDGMWALHAKMPAAFTVKQTAEAIIEVAPVGMAKGCPAVASVVFEMPSHGHGGDKTPEVMSMGTCQFHVSNLSPSMGGDWRLRLVLKNGDKTSNGDFNVPAK